MRDSPDEHPFSTELPWKQHQFDVYQIQGIVVVDIKNADCSK